MLQRFHKFLWTICNPRISSGSTRGIRSSLWHFK